MRAIDAGNTRALPSHRRGLTLIETLVVAAIVVVLTAIVYAMAGPAREKARETICLSHLKQLGQGFRMYQDDYGDPDARGLVTAADLGLPLSPGAVTILYLHRAFSLWECPSDIRTPAEIGGERGRWIFSYHGFFLRGERPGPTSGSPPFSQVVASRGDDTPLLTDPFHGRASRQSRGPGPMIVLVLRLDGRVQRSIVPATTPTWQY